MKTSHIRKVYSGGGIDYQQTIKHNQNYALYNYRHQQRMRTIKDIIIRLAIALTTVSVLVGIYLLATS